MADDPAALQAALIGLADANEVPIWCSPAAAPASRPRDRTPQATAGPDYEVPGIPEASGWPRLPT